MSERRNIIDPVFIVFVPCT